MTRHTRPPSNTRPVVFAPGDRVRFRTTDAGRRTVKIGIAGETLDGYTQVRLADGRIMAPPTDALTLLPPAKTRAPGAGRPTTTATLRVGDVLAVRDVTPDGTTPLRRYTVASVEDTADGLRVELAGDDGAGMVVVR